MSTNQKDQEVLVDQPMSRRAVRAGRDFMSSISHQVRGLITAQNTTERGKKTYKTDSHGVPYRSAWYSNWYPPAKRQSSKRAWKNRGKISTKKYRRCSRFGGRKSLN